MQDLSKEGMLTDLESNNKLWHVNRIFEDDFRLLKWKDYHNRE